MLHCKHKRADKWPAAVSHPGTMGSTGAAARSARRSRFACRSNGAPLRQKTNPARPQPCRICRFKTILPCSLGPLLRVGGRVPAVCGGLRVSRGRGGFGGCRFLGRGGDLHAGVRRDIHGDHRAHVHLCARRFTGRHHASGGIGAVVHHHKAAGDQPAAL